MDVMATQLVAPSPCDTLTNSGILPWLRFGGDQAIKFMTTPSFTEMQPSFTGLSLLSCSWSTSHQTAMGNHLGTTRISLQISTLSFTFFLFWGWHLYIMSIIYLHNVSNPNIHKLNFKTSDHRHPKKNHKSQPPIRIHKFSASVGTGIFNFAFLKTAALPSTHEGKATVPLMVAFPNTKKTQGKHGGEDGGRRCRKNGAEKNGGQLFQYCLEKEKFISIRKFPIDRESFWRFVEDFFWFQSWWVNPLHLGISPLCPTIMLSWIVVPFLKWS